MLGLNCLVLGEDQTHVFGVDIEDNKKVSALRDSIKEKKKPAFDHIPADALQIYKVSIPVDAKLDATLNRFRPEHDPDNGVHHLSMPMKRLNVVFEDPVDEHIHVIVLPPCPPAVIARKHGLKEPCSHDQSLKRQTTAYYKDLPDEAPLAVAPSTLTDIHAGSKMQIFVNPLCPLPCPNTFTDLASSKKVNFKLTDQPLPTKLIFLALAEPNDFPMLLVKFVRGYGKDLHQHCADLDHAPPLLGFETMSGGWNMVVMQFMEDHVGFSTFPNRSSVSSDLRAKLMTLLDSFHKKNLVHGDLRPSNVLVRDDGNGKVSMMLVDFDWGGSEGEVRYPLALNRRDIKRPEGVVDGGLITKEHDLRMVDDMFPGLP